jgi:hypothetical protein
VVALLVGLGVLDYGAAKGLRALRDRADRAGSVGPVTGGVLLSAESPVTLVVPGRAPVGDGSPSVAVPAGVSVFVAPSLIGRVELAGVDSPASVDAFGLPDSARPDLPVPEANRGALIARLEDDLPFPIGSRSCIFTAGRDGRLYFGINDVDPSQNRGSFNVTVSIPEIRSVLAATPACGTILR